MFYSAGSFVNLFVYHLMWKDFQVKLRTLFCGKSQQQRAEQKTQVSTINSGTLDNHNSTQITVTFEIPSQWAPDILPKIGSFPSNQFCYHQISLVSDVHFTFNLLPQKTTNSSLTKTTFNYATHVQYLYDFICAQIQYIEQYFSTKTKLV